MSRILKCDYNFNQPNFELVTDNAKDFITKLLVIKPSERMTATTCLQHPWLTHIGLDSGLSEKEHWTTLETAWMRSILARRRWIRWFHAVKASHRFKKLSLENWIHIFSYCYIFENIFYLIFFIYEHLWKKTFRWSKNVLTIIVWYLSDWFYLKYIHVEGSLNLFKNFIIKVREQ